MGVDQSKEMQFGENIQLAGFILDVSVPKNTLSKLSDWLISNITPQEFL